MNDLKFAVRQLLKSPGFTAVAVLTLALGIGANLAIFTFANSLLIRPLPGIHDADRLVIVKEQTGGPMSYPDYGDFRDGNSALTHLAAFAHSPFSLSAANLTERVMGEMVTGNYFRTLRVSMAAGRDFLPEEDQVASRNPVAIISYRLWQRRWKGDPAAVGKQVTINGHSFTIVGVAAERFRGCVLPIGDDLSVPIHAQTLLQASTVDRLGDRRFAWLERLVGRLKPDATLAQAQAEIALIGSQLQTAYPDDKKDQSFRAGAYNPFGAAGKPGNALIFLGILTAITVLVLCVVCANVANLFLARALARRREVAIRLALGSSRWRLVRQMLTEGLIIALLGAGLGTIAALGGAEELFAQIPGHLGEPIAVDVAADGRVVGVGIVLALFSTLACGLLPALRTSGLDLLPALKAGEASYSPRATRLR